MNKEQMIELYNDKKPDSMTALLIDKMLEYKRVGFIIVDVLPAIRDTKEFQEELKHYIWNLGSKEFPNEWCLFEVGKFPKRALVGYELEYCKEVLK